MPCSVLFVRHVHQQLVTPADKLSYLSVSDDLVVLARPLLNDVIVLESCKILDESVSPKDGHIIEPSVTRSC